MQALTFTLLMTVLLTGSAFGQEYKNYVVASGNLVEKSKVKELTGVLRQKSLWIQGADGQSHPACIVQLSDSPKGVFVMDYRPASAVGSKVRISAVPMPPVVNPKTDVRTASGSLDSSIDASRAAKCYSAVRNATLIDYTIAQRGK